MLSVNNFRKYYGDRLILEIPQLELSKGIYWIKGSNGSGKSTFFKSICGIISFEGDAVIDQVSLKKEPIDYRRLISYAEAEPLYPGFLTLKDLMAFVGTARKASIQQQKEIIEKLGMDEFREQPVNTYSSGMLKKVSLGLALLGSPKVICLDEPFTTIDHDSLLKFIDLINDYHNNQGVTFLISSHVEEPDSKLTYDSIYKIDSKSIHKQHELAI